MVKPVTSITSVSSINVYQANLGEGLSWHNHDNSHTTMCRRGSCIVRTEGKPDVILTPSSNPKQITHVAYLMHEIEALEDGTEIVNMFFD